jgi:hypothetical protein
VQPIPTEAYEFYEFATSHHDRRSPPRMKIAQAIFTSVSRPPLHLCGRP